MFTDGKDFLERMTYGTIYNFFSDHFGNVRGMLIENEPWVVGKDVAKALGYKKPDVATVKRVYPEYKQNKTVYVNSDGNLYFHLGSTGQNRVVTFINEPGIYQLIFSSKLKSAVKFQKWVFSEVLPSIRATGTYIDPHHELIWHLCRNVRTHVEAAIARLIRYAKSRGKEFGPGEEPWTYAKITSYINKICGIPTGQRSFVETVNLINCIGVKAQIASVIDYGIESKFEYEKIVDDCYKYASWYIRQVSESISTTTKKPIAIYLDETNETITLVNKPKKLVLSINGIDHDIRTTTQLAG